MRSEREKSGKDLPEATNKDAFEGRDALPIWRDIATSFLFLSRIPMPYYGRSLAKSAWAFPVVGWVVGAIGAFIFIACSYVGLTGWIAAVMAIGATIIITGALHEDGFADMADGFWGGHSIEKRLSIMRDSAIGAYGTIALILNISLRAGALATLYNPMLILAIMIAAHGLSRASMALVMCFITPAGKTGMAATAGRVSRPLALMAFLLGIFPFIVFAPMQAAVLLALIPIAAGMVFIQIMKRKLGGYNGDSLGALGQVVEIATYLGCVAVGNSFGFSFAPFIMNLGN